MTKQGRTKNIAVVIVDMQDFFLKKFKPEILDALIKNHLVIIDFCIKNRLPFIVVEYKAGGKFRGKTIQKLDNRIKNVHKETFIKEHNSAFTDTKLDEILKNLKTKEVLLIGINANACIQDTAIGALHRGYKVVTGHGIIACTSRKDLELSKRNRKWYLKDTTYFDDIKGILDYVG